MILYLLLKCFLQSKFKGKNENESLSGDAILISASGDARATLSDGQDAHTTGRYFIPSTSAIE